MKQFEMWLKAQGLRTSPQREVRSVGARVLFAEHTLTRHGRSFLGGLAMLSAYSSDGEVTRVDFHVVSEAVLSGFDTGTPPSFSATGEQSKGCSAACYQATFDRYGRNLRSGTANEEALGLVAGTWCEALEGVGDAALDPFAPNQDVAGLAVSSLGVFVLSGHNLPRGITDLVSQATML